MPVVKTATRPSHGLIFDKEKSLWNFREHGVTSSFLNSFLTCLEQTRLCYLEGWSSRTVPMAFEFGTCMHWILEQVYSQLELPTEAQIKKHVKQYEQSWLKATPTPTSRQLEQQELCYGMAEAVLPTYFERWSGDFTGKYKYPNQTTTISEWVSLEEVFEVPYTYPDGLVVPIRGRRDGVFKNPRGRKFVFDTKCRSVINHDDAMDTLPLDLQQMMYLMVTAQEFNEYPDGTVMNIIRRPGQRRGINESLKTFLDRVRSEVSKEKNFDHYFIRYEMIVTKPELTHWRKTIFDPLMMAVRMWYEGTLPHYMNHNALSSKYGHCALYLPLVKGDFSQCYKRKAAFNELAEV